MLYKIPIILNLFEISVLLEALEEKINNVEDDTLKALYEKLEDKMYNVNFFSKDQDLDKIIEAQKNLCVKKWNGVDGNG